jgi:hypothetical protein
MSTSPALSWASTRRSWTRSVFAPLAVSRQILFLVVLGDDDATVRENDFCGEKIIEGEAETADQRPIAASQGEAGDTDGADRACDGREAKPICHCDDVCGTGAPRNCCGMII